MYFDKFPKINYTFSNGKTLNVVDVFRKVSFTQQSLNNSTLFMEVTNGVGIKPETLSSYYYNNPEFSWVIFLANQTVNPSFDWPLEYSLFLNSLNVKYTGTSHYIAGLPELEEGDVAVQATFNQTTNELLSIDLKKYGLITEWNREFRYFVGILPDEPIGKSTYCIFLRKNSQGNFVPLKDSNDNIIRQYIYKTELYIETPRYFKSGDLIISPYRIVDGNNRPTESTANPKSTSITIPAIATDSTTIYNTIIFRYMTQGIVPLGIDKSTNFQEEIAKQNLLYNIKMVKPEAITSVIQLFNSTINSNTVGRAQQLQLFI